MSESEEESEFDDEEEYDDENTELGEEENEKEDGETDKDVEEAEHEGGEEKGSVASGGFDAEVGEKAKPKEMPKETPLTIDHVKAGISMLCKTGDGLEIAYVKLVAQGLELTNVFLLSTYIHLRYVDLSNNQLTSLYPLQNMRFLVSLKVSYNKLTSAQLSNFPFLQFLDLTGNLIKNTQGIKQQSLEKLILSKNKLDSLQDMTADNLPNLIHLNITQNSLKNLDGLELPTLKNLYAARNKLKSLAGLSRLTSLARLHLRDNRINSLAGLDDDNTSLEYLNIRGNNVEDVEELYELRRLRKLKVIVVEENPFSDESDAYRVDVLVYARRLERIDKEPVEEEEREEATDLYPQREEDRLLAADDSGGSQQEEAPDELDGETGNEDEDEEQEG
ncbi:leucine-rich repeat-containing protein 23-like [Pollicipes pollicipes]|uniref:leucine-rich repeat-containing protein 23-like n=1 Tax=Pollicipes pollicipes TaxID=41117 RepID=UPI001885585B|nr:leucine-rich repeat-containing protein 23-like [Pollicipes pollicipes]